MRVHIVFRYFILGRETHFSSPISGYSGPNSKEIRKKKKLATGTSAEAAPAAPPLVSSYVLSDIEQPAAAPDPSEDAKVACV